MTPAFKPLATVVVYPEQPSPYRRLWTAVTAQAVQDLRSRTPDLMPTTAASQAAAWFNSDQEEPGSFQWVCAALEINHGRALAALRARGDLPARGDFLQ